MSWRITPTYTVIFPVDPENGESWIDLNTGILWIYSEFLDQWGQGGIYEANVYEAGVFT
jgi:hypothetical protein